VGFERYPDHSFRYLARANVIEACQFVDVVEAVEEALRLHALGGTTLPAEAYLGWTTADGHAARCLAMPGALDTPTGRIVGLKTINASLGNPARGLPRSQGFTVLLDPATAQPLALMEAAYISAMRTAAVTAVTAARMATTEPESLALIGCGTLAHAHLSLLLARVTSLRRLFLYDSVRQRAADLAATVPELSGGTKTDVVVTENARECVRAADIVVPVTTVTEGYIEADWLRPGTLVAHVSLDDLTEDAVLRADVLVVDDWELVSDDPRRLLGRMYRAGSLLDPTGAPRPGTRHPDRARQVDATLGDVVTGRHPGRRKDSDVVISNPFGMATLDVAVAHRVLRAAEARGIGRRLAL
jgi:ornithine cyclodeaminase